MNDILKFIISLIFSIIVLVVISGFIADSNIDFGIATVFIAIIIFAIPFIISMALLEHFSEKQSTKGALNNQDNKEVLGEIEKRKDPNLRVNKNEDWRNDSGKYQKKNENENHERFIPKPSKTTKFQSDYSESIKKVENIGYNRFHSSVGDDIYELIRNGKDYPGETSRILTESYFGVGYNEDDKIDSMQNLIEFRAAAYSLFGLHLDENISREIAIDFCDNFAVIVLCLTYFEINNNPEKKEFFQKMYPLIYKIIAEEHIKVAERLNRVPVISSIADRELMQSLNRIIS